MNADFTDKNAYKDLTIDEIKKIIATLNEILDDRYSAREELLDVIKKHNIPSVDAVKYIQCYDPSENKSEEVMGVNVSRPNVSIEYYTTLDLGMLYNLVTHWKWLTPSPMLIKRLNPSDFPIIANGLLVLRRIGTCLSNSSTDTYVVRCLSCGSVFNITAGAISHKKSKNEFKCSKCPKKGE